MNASMNLFQPMDSNEASIGLDDFELLRVIGRGSYAKVFMIEQKRNKRIYAMKVIKKELVNDDEVSRNSRPFDLVNLYYWWRLLNCLELSRTHVIHACIPYCMRWCARLHSAVNDLGSFPSVDNLLFCVPAGHWLGADWEACVWSGLESSFLSRAPFLLPDTFQVRHQLAPGLFNHWWISRNPLAWCY